MTALSMQQAIQITALFKDPNCLNQEKMHSLSEEYRKICKAAFEKVKYASTNELEGIAKDISQNRTFRVIDEEAELDTETFNAFTTSVTSSIEKEEEPVVSTFTKVINAIIRKIVSIFTGIRNLFGRIGSAELCEMGNEYLLDRDNAAKKLLKYKGNSLEVDDAKKGQIAVETTLIEENSRIRNKELAKAEVLNNITLYLEELNILSHQEKIVEELAGHANIDPNLMGYLKIEPIAVKSLTEIFLGLDPLEGEDDLINVILSDFVALQNQIHDEREECKNNPISLSNFDKQCVCRIQDEYKAAWKKLEAEKAKLFSKEGELAKAMEALKEHSQKLIKIHNNKDLLMAKYGLS